MNNEQADFFFQTDYFYNAEIKLNNAIDNLNNLNSCVSSINSNASLLGSTYSTKVSGCKTKMTSIVSDINSLISQVSQLKEQLYNCDPNFAAIYDMLDEYGADLDTFSVSDFQQPTFTSQYDYLWANLTEEEKSENMIKNCDAAIQKLEDENAKLWNEWSYYFNGGFVIKNYGLTYSFGVLDTPEFLREGNFEKEDIWSVFDSNSKYYVDLINEKYNELYGENFFNKRYTVDDFRNGGLQDQFAWNILIDAYIEDYTKKYNRYMVDKAQLDAENDERMARIKQVEQELASIRASKYSIQQYQKELPYLRIAETDEYKKFVETYKKNNPKAFFVGSDVPEDMILMQAYLLKTQGQGAVDAYNVAVEDKWNQIKAAREAKKYIDMITGPDGKIDQNLLTGCLTAGEGLWAGLVNFGEGLGNLFNDEGMISVNSYTQMYILEALTNTSGSYANELAASIYQSKGEEEYNTFVEKVGLKTGKLDLEYAKSVLSEEEYKLLEEKYNFDNNNVLGHTYKISTSIGNMAPTMITSLVLSKVLGPAIGGKVGAILASSAPVFAGGMMAWSSAGNAYNQAMVDGYDRTASYQYGICSGLSEATMTLLLSNIPGLNIIGDTGLFGEGAEEFIQTYVDAGFRHAILGEPVDLESLSEEAKMSFWYGVITAGVMDGGVSMASNVYTELKTGGVNVSNYQDLVNYALITNNKSIVVNTKGTGDSKQVVISVDAEALKSDSALASKLHSLYPEAVLLRNNPNGTVSIIDPDFSYTIDDVSKIFADTKAIIRNPDGTISPVTENIGLEGEISTTDYINRKQEINIQQAINYELYQKQVSLIRAELSKIDYGKASTSKYIIDYLASNLKKFFYTDTNTVSGLNQEIAQNGLYHFTTAADQIIESGYIRSSDMVSSYGNPKTFFFNGVPSVGAFATNLDSVPLKTVAVKVTPTSESLESSKFKVRYMDDKAITYDGKFQLEGSKVEKCYFGLTLENGKLVYKQISEAAYNSYESTALGAVMSEYVNNADNVAAIKADYLSNLAKENKLSISKDGRLLKDGEKLNIGLQFFADGSMTPEVIEAGIKNGSITKGQVKNLLTDLIGDKLDSWVLSDDAGYSLYMNLLTVCNNAGISVSDVKNSVSVMEAMAKYYENARDNLNVETGGEVFNTYRTHGIVHIIDVMTQSINSYAAFKNSGIGDLSLETIMLSAVMHDTGMSGGQQVKLSLDENDNFIIKTVDIASNGQTYRESHSFNSAVNILNEYEALRNMGYTDVQIAEAALLTFAHSKSNSGLNPLSENPSGWSFAIQALAKATEGSEFNLIDVLVERGALISSDTVVSQSKIIVKTPDGKVEGHIGVYNFNENWLKTMGYESLVIRLGDALTNNDNAGTNQYGNEITFESTDYNKQISLSQILTNFEIDPSLSFDKQFTMLKEKLGKVAGYEAKDITYEVGGQTYNSSQQFVLGENNQTYSVTNGVDGSIEVVISVKNSDAIPFCTLFAIDERAGELNSKGNGLFGTDDSQSIKMVIEIDASASADIKNLYYQYAEFYNNKDGAVPVEIREISTGIVESINSAELSGNTSQDVNKNNGMILNVEDGVNTLQTVIEQVDSVYGKNAALNQIYDYMVNGQEPSMLSVTGDFRNIVTNIDYDTLVECYNMIVNSQNEVITIKDEILGTMPMGLDKLTMVRYLYLELNKRISYDVGYFKSEETVKSEIYTTDVSFDSLVGNKVICRGWSQLFQELLLSAGIEPSSVKIRGSDKLGAHKWVEIEFDDYIIRADATDAFNHNIDLSASKSGFSTNGFIAIDKSLSGVNISKAKHPELGVSMYEYLSTNMDNAWLREIDNNLGYTQEGQYFNETVNSLMESFYSPGIVEKVFGINQDKLLDSKIDSLFNLSIDDSMNSYDAYAYLKQVKHALFGSNGTSKISIHLYGRDGSSTMAPVGVLFVLKQEQDGSLSARIFDDKTGECTAHFDSYNQYNEYIKNLNYVGIGS